MVRNASFGLVLGALATPASATLLIYEPFDYSPAGAELSTADGAGGWQKVPATTTLEPTIQAGSLGYTGLPWTPAGNSVAMTGGATAVQASSTRQIPGQPYESAEEPTLYYSMLFRVDNVTGTTGKDQPQGGSFVAGFRSDTGTGGLTSPLNAGAPLLIRTGSTAGVDYQLGTGLTPGNASNPDRVYDDTTDYQAGQTLLLVLSYQFVAGADDFARMWVNPDPALSAEDNSGPGLTVGNALKVVATATDGHGINGGQITNFFLRNNGSAPDNFSVDELRVASSWEGLWTTAITGVWLGGTGNWSDSTMWSGGVVPSLATQAVQIDNNNAAAASVVTLDQDVTVRSVALDAGDTLNIPVGRSLTLSSALIVNGVVNNSGALNAGAITVSGGELRYDAGTIAPTSINLSSGGKLLMAAGGDKTLNATSLSVSSSSLLDVADNKVIVDNGTVGTWTGTNYTGLTGAIRSAFNGGDWDGNGITTTMPDATTGVTALGIATAEQVDRDGSTFGGVSVDAGDVLIMYTYGGDANLDGLVSGDDYTAIDFNILVPGADGWVNGDFNYDGIISGDDYTVIDFNILAQGAPFPVAGSAAGGAAGGGVAAVPEPASICGVAALAAGLFMRRRRNQPRLRP